MCPKNVIVRNVSFAVVLNKKVYLYFIAPQRSDLVR